MKAMTIDSTPAARRISALRSSVRNLGAIFFHSSLG